MFKNLPPKDVTELTNSLKKLDKPAILLLGFLGFCITLSNMENTPLGDENSFSDSEQNLPLVTK